MSRRFAYGKATQRVASTQENRSLSVLLLYRFLKPITSSIKPPNEDVLKGKIVILHCNMLDSRSRVSGDDPRCFSPFHAVQHDKSGTSQTPSNAKEYSVLQLMQAESKLRLDLELEILSTKTTLLRLFKEFTRLCSSCYTKFSVSVKELQVSN